MKLYGSLFCFDRFFVISYYLVDIHTIVVDFAMTNIDLSDLFADLAKVRHYFPKKMHPRFHMNYFVSN